ncbi:MAG: carbohydrate binding domain-containing protein, partial [Clostridia bacterium]|nr:carbohydrate binding domain-containing protein [Clostridia bacterium]
MKKRRLLSMLLAMMLISSSMPITATAAPVAEGEAESTSTTIVEADGWLANGAAPATATDADADGDGKYIHVGADTVLPGIVYANANVTLKAGKTYKFVVSMRSTPVLNPNAEGDADKLVNIRVRLTGLWDKLLPQIKNHGTFETLVASEALSAGTFTIKDTWTENYVIFKVGASDITLAGPGINFRGGGGVKDAASFDIDAMGIYEVEKSADSGNYLLVNNNNLVEDYLDISRWGTHSNIGSASSYAEVIDTEEYYSAAAGTENTVITALDQTSKLASGTYTLTGDFRVGGGVKIEELSAAYASKNVTLALNAAIGSVKADTAKITPFEFKTVSFNFDLPAGGTLADLAITLDGVRPLDFKNLELVYAPYTVNEDWAGDNDIGARYISSEAYTIISAADSSAVGSANAYSVGGQDLPAGNYKLKFSVRNDPNNADAANTMALRFGGYVESCGAVLKVGDRHAWGNTANAKLFTVNSVKANGVAYTGSSDPAVTSAWVTYEADITSYVAAPFKLIIGGAKSAINIKDWSIEGFDGTYTFSGVTYPSYKQIAGTATEIAPYYTTAQTGTTALVYVGDNTTEYTAGSYTISASVRANANTTLTADIKGTTASAELTANTWQTVTLKLEMREKFTMSDIVIDLGGAELDFTDIEFSGVQHAVSKDWMTSDGKQVIYIDEEGGYTCLAPIEEFTEADGSVYTSFFKLLNLPVGSYKISYKARLDASTPYSANYIFAGIGGVYSGNTVFNAAGATGNSDNFTVVSASIGGTPVTSKTQFTALTEDWVTFETEITNTAAADLYLGVFKDPNTGVALANIKDLTITETTANTPVDFAFNSYENSSMVLPGGNAYVPVSHYTTAGTNSSQLVYIGAEKNFKAGLYTFEAMVKSSEASTPLALSVANTNILVTNTITNQWQNVTFEIDARSDFDMNDIVLDFAGDLYFTEFTMDGYTYTFNDAWTGNNGEKPVLVEVTEDYIKLMPDPDNMPIDVLNPDGSVRFAGSYRYDVVTLPAGSYTVSFKARLDSSAVVNNGIEVALGGYNNVESAWSIFNRDNYAGDATIDYAKVDGLDNTYVQFNTLTNDWQSFEASFTSTSEYTLKLIALNRDTAMNIKDFCIMDNTANTEVGGYKFNESADNNYGGKAGTYSIPVPYYTTNGTEATAIEPIVGKDCEPGLYTITGKFSAPTDATLNATIEGNVYASVEITDTLTEYVLEIDAREPFDMADLELAFDSDYLNFTDITIKEEVYTTLGNWEGENGEIIVKVEFDDNYYVLGSGNTDESNTAAYSYKEKEIPAGSYKLTFDARLDPDAPAAISTYINLRLGYVESCGSLHNAQDRHIWNDVNNKKLFTVTSSKVDGVEVTSTSTRTIVNKEWTTYEIEFTSYDSYSIWMIIDGPQNDINIRNYSVVNTANENAVLLNDVSAWAPTGNGYGSTGGTIRMEQSYYTTAGSGTGSISPAIGSESDYLLSAGTYHIKGTFRAHDADAVLSAFAGSTALRAYSGNSDITLSGKDWRDVTFVLSTRVELNTTDIRLMFNNDIDFLGDIQIELIEKYVDLSTVDIGTVMTLLMLKREENAAYDPTNHFSLAITRSGAKQWATDGQTITFHTADDGNFIRVSDIKKNTDSLVYRPGVILKPGLYILSVELRASNPGEKTKLRLTTGGDIYSEALNNEWTKVEFMFEVEKKQDLFIKIFGGPMSKFTKDFDIRNLNLINTDDIEGGFNLYQVGDFETEGVYGWIPGYGAGYGKVKWMQEENGNGFLRVYDRPVGHAPVNANLGFKAVIGATYNISYDIRASHEGDVFTVRSYMNNVGLTVANANPNSPIEFDITHEWLHVESTFVATESGPLTLEIKGGQSTDSPDENDFDFDNITIIKSGGATEDDLYPAGTFDDKVTATALWKPGYGSMKFTWNEENGDGYITVSDRDVNHSPARLTGPFAAEAGRTYTISYDIRATNEGEEFTVRAYVNNTALKVDNPSNANGNEFIINHEWRHVETTYVASADGGFLLDIKGGQTIEDNKSFDLNNVKISV